MERAILPNGQVSESVISFNEPNEYWKPRAGSGRRAVVYNELPNNKIEFHFLFIVCCLHFSKSIDLFHLILHFIFSKEAKGRKKCGFHKNKNWKTEVLRSQFFKFCSRYRDIRKMMLIIRDKYFDTYYRLKIVSKCFLNHTVSWCV